MEPGDILKGHKKIIELCMPYTGRDSLKDRVNIAIENGYNTIVLDTFIPSSSNLETFKKSKQYRSSLVLPPAIEIPDYLLNLTKTLNDSDSDDEPLKKKLKLEPQKNTQSIKFLRRATIELKINDDQHKLRRNTQNPNISDYDIIAVLPRTLELLHLAAISLDVDLVVLDLPELKLQDVNSQYMFPKRNSIKPAKDRQVFFELWYSKVLSPTNYTSLLPKLSQCIDKIIFNTAHCNNYKSITPNIILSSNATSKFDTRSQKDLINFLDLFDIDEAKATNIIRKHPMKVLVHAFQRKTCKSAVFVEAADSGQTLEENEKEMKIDDKISQPCSENLNLLKKQIEIEASKI